MKTAVRTGSIVLASLLAVVMAPRASIRPAEAERIVVANEHASTVQFFDLKTGNVLKNIPTLNAASRDGAGLEARRRLYQHRVQRRAVP